MGIKSKIAKILYTLGTVFGVYKLAEYIYFVLSTQLAVLTIGMFIAGLLCLVGIFALILLWFIFVAC